MIKPVYVVVAFRYDQANSVVYYKHPSPELISKVVHTALTKHGADVISIRKVYEKCPMPQ